MAAGGRNVHVLAKELEREWPANLRSYTRPLQPGRVQSLFSSSWGLSAAVSCLRTSRICFPHVHNSEDEAKARLAELHKKAMLASLDAAVRDGPVSGS